MLRKLVILAVAAAVLGLAAFWFLTAPGTVPASALGSHTPDATKGRTVFFAGGGVPGVAAWCPLILWTDARAGQTCILTTPACANSSFA